MNEFINTTEPRPVAIKILAKVGAASPEETAAFQKANPSCRVTR